MSFTLLPFSAPLNSNQRHWQAGEGVPVVLEEQLAFCGEKDFWGLPVD